MPIKTALIVDDDANSRNTAHDILMSLGVIDIHFAQNGAEAAKKLATVGPIDLVLCDIFMPEKDGIEFIEDLAHAKFKGRLILMSSNGAHFMELTQLIAKRKNIKIGGLLSKPISKDSVAGAIAS